MSFDPIMYSLCEGGGGNLPRLDLRELNFIDSEDGSVALPENKIDELLSYIRVEEAMPIAVVIDYGNPMVVPCSLSISDDAVLLSGVIHLLTAATLYLMIQYFPVLNQCAATVQMVEHTET